MTTEEGYEFEKDPSFLDPVFSEINALSVVQAPTNRKWVKQLKSGGRSLDYVSGDTVTRLLNKAFKYKWSFYIMESHVVESQDKYDKKTGKTTEQGAVVQVRGRLVVPGWGVREQWGAQPLIGGADVQEHAFKSASTDAMKKCASMFGVALDLYGKEGIDDLRVTPMDMLTDDKVYLDKLRKRLIAEREKASEESDKTAEDVQEGVEKDNSQAQPQAQPDPQQDLGDGDEMTAPEYREAPVAPPAEEKQVEAPSEPTQTPQAEPEKETTGSYWQPEDIKALKQFKADKGITDNNGLTPYVQKFLNSQEASYVNLSPDNVKDFLHFVLMQS